MVVWPVVAIPVSAAIGYLFSQMRTGDTLGVAGRFAGLRSSADATLDSMHTMLRNMQSESSAADKRVMIVHSGGRQATWSETLLYLGIASSLAAGVSWFLGFRPGRMSLVTKAQFHSAYAALTSQMSGLGDRITAFSQQADQSFERVGAVLDDTRERIGDVQLGVTNLQGTADRITDHVQRSRQGIELLVRYVAGGAAHSGLLADIRSYAADSGLLTGQQTTLALEGHSTAASSSSPPAIPLLPLAALSRSPASPAAPGADPAPAAAPACASSLLLGTVQQLEAQSRERRAQQHVV